MKLLGRFLRSYTRIENLSDLKFFLITILLLLVVTSIVYLKGYTDEPIRSDGKGYYLYLPGVFIHKDLNLEWTKELRNEDEKYKDLSIEWNGTKIYSKTSTIINKYTIGLSILWAPFFFVAYSLQTILGSTNTGFELVYQLAIVTAGIFYLSLGLVFLRKVLYRHFSQKASLSTIVILLLGTNLLHYGTYDLNLTHIYSFTLLSLILYFTPNLYKAFSYKNLILIAALVALSFLIRPTNLIAVFLITLYGVKSHNDFKPRLSLYLQNYEKIILAALIALLIVIPQFIYWKYITGDWMVFSYQGEYFDFLKPQIFNVLFSVKKGLFFWSPILIFSFAGFAVGFRNLRNWLLAFVIYFGLSIFIISSWWSWQYGSSFGHRAFVDHFPILSFGIAGFLSWLKDLKKVELKYVFSIILILTLLFSLFNQLQYWQGDIPKNDVTLDHLKDSWKHQVGLVKGLSVKDLGSE